MIKNTASQIVGAQMVSASDGSAFTSTVTAYITLDGGTQALGTVGSGVCTHEGNGYHSYAPSQAETNGDLVAVTFIGTGAIPATLQIYTVGGDAFTRLGAPAGASVSADIAAVKSDSAAILTDTAEIGAAGAGLTALATASALATVDANVDTILAAVDTEVAAILAAVDTEVAAILALLDDARGEPAQGSPPVNPDMATKVDYLYKFARNKVTQTATTLSIYDDAGTTVDHKSTVSDDGTTYTRGELATGP